MAETPILKQKQAGLILMILGGFLFLFIFLFLYFNVIRIPGFPELLPVKETALFVEFPLALEEPIAKRLNETLSVDWNKDVAPFGGDRGALVFLKEKNDLMLPYVFLKVRSIEQALTFLKNYQNPKKEVREIRIAGIAAFSTPSIHFAFLSNVLVLSPSETGLATLLSFQSPKHQHLSSEKKFTRIRQNVPGPFFAYIKPKEIPDAAFQWISQFVPRMPSSTFSFEILGIAAEKKENTWHGKSYAIFDSLQPTTYNLQPHQAYRAQLLPFLPEDLDLFLGGQNLFAQLEKIDAEELAAAAIEKYLPGVSFEKEIAPLVSSEFALTRNADKVLFVSELRDQSSADQKVAPGLIEKIRAAFAKASPALAQKTREVKLPDGTTAKEFIPDPGAVKSFEETFREISIKGFTLGKTGAVYDAVTQGKWFVSNDLATLQKALLLTQEPGRNFRDSERYRQMLQPMLVNPELLGVTSLSGFSFSFSKRTHEDHMETNFMLR